MPESGALDFPLQIQAAEGSGPDAVSPKGARGIMQVMPATAASPGFGIAPASGPNDLTRLGQQYAQAMLLKYGGNRVLAAAAYNAGPGRVDQWLQQFGDPRGGGITDADWVKRIPVAETQRYAGKFLGAPLSMSSAGPPASGTMSNFLALQNTPKDLGDASETGPATLNPAWALELLSLLAPKGHQLVQVDYDPWKYLPPKVAPSV